MLETLQILPRRSLVQVTEYTNLFHQGGHRYRPPLRLRRYGETDFARR